MKTWLVLLAIALTSAIPAKAGPMTAGELGEVCRPVVADNPPKTLMDALSAGQCQGFVRAWMDTSLVVPVIPNTNDRNQFFDVHFKDDVNLGQVIRVYCLFIKQHPEKENDFAVVELLDAMVNAKLVEVTNRKP